MADRRQIGVRYCGGCNPRYDRVALVKRIGGFFPEAEFVTAQAGVKYPAVLVVCGCPSRCANVSDLAVPAGRLIYLSGWEELLPAKEKLAEALKGQQARSLTHEEVLDILEENQLAVVADDLAQESRQYRTDTPEKGGGALKRLALQWNARYGCSLIHELGKPRGKMLAKMCQETGAQGVISCMMKFCDPEEYDEPYLEADLRKAGIHVMNIDIDPLNHSYEQVRTRVQSFCEML